MGERQAKADESKVANDSLFRGYCAAWLVVLALAVIAILVVTVTLALTGNTGHH